MIILTNELMRKIYPKGNSAVIAAIIANQSAMKDILSSVNRAAFCFANCFAETAGMSLASLTENTHYTAERMAFVWRNRFHDNPANVIAKYGSGPNWRDRAFDDIYGNRMGNRPGTSDGSRYIGRGAPQVTGRDGYVAVGQRIGVDLANAPERAAEPGLQAAIIAAFWDWKVMSRFADQGAAGILAGRKAWNGGTNGLATVQSEFKRISGILTNYNPATAATNVQAPKARFDPALKEIQQTLIDFGYFEVGEADGLIGGKTLGAIKAFFTDRHIDAKSEYPSPTLTAAIEDASNDTNDDGSPWHRPIAYKRAYATEKEVADKVDSVAPTQRAGLWATITGIFGFGTSAVKGIAQFMPDANDQAQPYVSIVQQYWDSIPGWVFPVIIAAFAFFIWRETRAAKVATVADYQQGKIN